MDITGIAAREIDKPGLSQFIRNLDEKSRAILDYLWWHRHAGISELRNIGYGMDDFEVLNRLKEIIGKKSQNLWGKPIVSFEHSKIDPLTGEKILFSWWYVDEDDSLVSGMDNALLDIFNEQDNITIIAQLPELVDLTAPDIQFKNGILRIEFKKTNFEQNTAKVA